MYQMYQMNKIWYIGNVVFYLLFYCMFNRTLPQMEAIKRLSDDICSSLDARGLRSAYQQARFGDRVYDYQELVLQACSLVLRSYVGEVYRFDGRVWVPCSDVVLEKALNRALVKRGVPKSDVSNSRCKLMSSAKGGASLSPLKRSHSVVAFRNGVWDFGDVFHPVYHPFSDRMPVVGVLPYDYDPVAVCPMWLSFLSSVLPKGEIVKLQKFLGLGCADRLMMSNKVERTLWLVGNGANGKSTVFDVVRGVYGADNLSYASLDTLISGSTEVRARFVGSIVGKVFNYCSEIQSDDIAGHADTFKSLCSGEPQTVRRLGQNPVTAYDIPFLVFNMNNMPSNRGLDKAMLRRLLFVRFRTTVSAEDMDSELSSKLMCELSGIRNWMLEGYRSLVRDGFDFGVSSCDDDGMTDYMLDNGQSVAVFLSKSGYSSTRRSGHWEDAAQWVPSSALYNEYMSFCNRWSLEPVSQRAFGGEMTRLGWSGGYGNRKRTSQGYSYGIFCGRDIDYALKI